MEFVKNQYFSDTESSESEVSAKLEDEEQEKIIEVEEESTMVPWNEHNQQEYHVSQAYS